MKISERLGRALAQVPPQTEPAPSSTILFGEYAPDQMAHGYSGLTVANNIVPQTQQSYGPLPSLSPISAAYSARPQGVFAAVDNQGNVNYFIASGAKIERQTVASATPEDVSKAGGYAVGADDLVDFIQFGTRVIGAMGLTDALQSYRLGTDTDFSNLSASAYVPKARYCTLWRNIPVFGNLEDPTDGTSPRRLRTPAYNDPTNWLQPGTAAAASVLTFQLDLRGNDGWIRRLVGGVGVADGLVLTERAAWRAQYVGLPDIFQLELVDGSHGTPAPGSVVRIGKSKVVYLTPDGWVEFDGASMREIGKLKVDRTFWNEVDLTYLSRLWAGYDPVNQRVIITYSTSGATPNKVMIYSPHLDRWTTGDEAILMVAAGLGLGYTLDQLDQFGTMDTLPFSLDSRAWTNNRDQVVGFDSSFRLSIFGGSNRAATIETGEYDMGKGQMFLSTGVRPLVDGGTITTAMKHRTTPQGSLTTTAAASADSRGGMHRHRVRDRYGRIQVNIAAAGTWTHAKGVEVYGNQDGWG